MLRLDRRRAPRIGRREFHATLLAAPLRQQVERRQSPADAGAAGGRLVAAPGLAAWRAASKKPAGYSFESSPTTLAKPYLQQFAANKQAYAYFRAEAPWYRRTTSFYVMSAKQEETRQRRLANLIACCEQQRRIGVLEGKNRKAKATPSQ